MFTENIKQRGKVVRRVYIKTEFCPELYLQGKVQFFLTMITGIVCWQTRQLLLA